MGDFISQVATRRAKSEDRNSNEDVSNAHNRRELPSRRQAYRYYFKLKCRIIELQYIYFTVIFANVFFSPEKCLQIQQVQKLKR